MEIQRPTYPIEIFTATRKVEGVFHPVGHVIDAVNDRERLGFYLTEATLTPLSSTSSLRPLAVPEAVVSKKEILFFRFKEKEQIRDLRMLQRVARMVVYTPAFALRGDFHLGGEQQPRDMFDTMKGNFQPLTDATIFPLIPTQVEYPRATELIFVNTQAVQMYHPENPTL